MDSGASKFVGSKPPGTAALRAQREGNQKQNRRRDEPAAVGNRTRKERRAYQRVLTAPPLTPFLLQSRGWPLSQADQSVSSTETGLLLRNVVGVGW